MVIRDILKSAYNDYSNVCKECLDVYKTRGQPAPCKDCENLKDMELIKELQDNDSILDFIDRKALM